MPMTQHNPTTIAAPVGAYSNGVSVCGGRWLHIAGQIGVDAAGILAPDLEGQAHHAWRNLVAVLQDAGMTVANLVKVNHFLTEPGDVAGYAAVRARYLGEARPASTLLIVRALAQPRWLVEVDAVAWAASDGTAP